MPIWPFKRRRAARGTRPGPAADPDAVAELAPDPELEPDPDPDFDPEAAVALPIDGELDLHHFRPAEVPSLVEAYIAECRERGILELRIVHGKGKGTLRRSVHAVLERLGDDVGGYRLAPPERGGWGATLVDLRAARAPGPRTDES